MDCAAARDFKEKGKEMKRPSLEGTVRRAAEPVALAPTRVMAKDRVKLTIRLNRETHDKLRRLAFDERRTIDAIVGKLIDDLLAKY